MVYNFNLGIGWASSGVEYAQATGRSFCGASGRRQNLSLRICFRRKIYSI